MKIRRASPLGLPYTLSRAPLRRRAPFAWLTRCARSLLAAGALLMLASVAIAATPQAGPESIEISIKRTPCFGMCPEYEVVIHGDGTVKYTGRTNVRVEGEQTWKIDPAAVRALAREMEQAGYFDLEDEYTAHVTDLPTTYTSLTIGARAKTVKNYFGAPQKLKDLEKRIEEVSGAKQYVLHTGPAIKQLWETGWSAAGRDAAGCMIRAIYAADTDVVSALLDAGFNAKAADADGVTLVMRAAEVGHAETVRLLLAAGADPTARDRSGRNAADRARDGIASGAPREYEAILKLLTDE